MIHNFDNCFSFFCLKMLHLRNKIEKVVLHCSGGTPGMYGLEDLGIPRWGYSADADFSSLWVHAGTQRTASQEVVFLISPR